MGVTRKLFDSVYDGIKSPVFYLTRRDPERAHELFSRFCRGVYSLGLERSLLDRPKVASNTETFSISTAAGFDKDAEIPPGILEYLGFDRAVIGTVIAEPYSGNERPRIQRLVELNSLVIWAGLPSKGVNAVAEALLSYRPSTIPITISLAPTPGKFWEGMLKDLDKSLNVLAGANIPNFDRCELNSSCPSDSRSFGDYLPEMLALVRLRMPDKKVFLKVSPDLDESAIEDLITQTYGFVDGYITTNTSREGVRRGGLSGDLLYSKATNVQRIFWDMVYGEKELIACGGISSVGRIKERLALGAKEIQIITPFIFGGPKLLRIFNEAKK